MTRATLPLTRVLVGVTGASGAPYADGLIKALLNSGVRTYVVFSDTARKVVATEASESFLAALCKTRQLAHFEQDEGLVALAAQSGLTKEALECLRIFNNDDLYAPVASGSEGATHMVVVPSSMGTLARIAHGISSTLLERAADVMLKEKRPLLVVPRETPLSVIHLQNMLTLAQAGAHIIPAMPAFYHRPKDIDALVGFVVERIVDALKIPDLALNKKTQWNVRML